MRTREKKRAISIVQAALAALVVLGAAWLVFKLVGYNQAQQIYRDADVAYAADVNGDYAGEPCPIDFESLRATYPDAVAWLKMDDVDISYPVVQGQDNDHYLHYDPSGAANIDGSIFLDARTKSLDNDLYAIVYGHNMLDESMFGQLDNYTSADFYNHGSGSFYLYTPKASYRYKIFAVNIVDQEDDIYQMGFVNTQVFSGFVSQLKQNSMYDTGVSVSGSDHIVTLSTCSSTDRLVISAKRM